MAAVDEGIRRANETYNTRRTGDFGMMPPELVRVAPRTFYEWMKSKGKLGDQNKVPRVVRSAEMSDELMAISRRLERLSRSRQR